MYDTIYCIEYSYLVLDTIYFARSKFCPSEVVQYNDNGFMGLFDSDNWIFEEDHPKLSETMLRRAPNGQKHVTHFKQIQRFLPLCVIGRIILITL